MNVLVVDEAVVLAKIQEIKEMILALTQAEEAAKQGILDTLNAMDTAVDKIGTDVDDVITKIQGGTTSQADIIAALGEIASAADALGTHVATVDTHVTTLGGTTGGTTPAPTPA